MQPSLERGRYLPRMTLLPPPCRPEPPPAAFREVFANAAFSVEMVPEPLWGMTLHNALPSADWAERRDQTLAAANHRCEACDERADLQCHEVWAYDDSACTQSFIELQALCHPCHLAKTPGRASMLVAEGYPDAFDQLLARIGRLNGWDATTTLAYVSWAARVNASRGDHAWKQRRFGGTRATDPYAKAGRSEATCQGCFMIVPAQDVSIRGRGSCCE